jgi:glycerol uptake facilitator-like aquaporin
VTSPHGVTKRAAVEGAGTGVILFTVVGSGAHAQQLAPASPGLQLLINSIATAVAVALAITFTRPLTGGHLNPLATLHAYVSHRVDLRGTILIIGAQTIGALLGVGLANVLFNSYAFAVSTNSRFRPETITGEMITTELSVRHRRTWTIPTTSRLASGSVACE